MGSENSPGNFQWDVPGPQCESPEEADEESLKVEDKRRTRSGSDPAVQRMVRAALQTRRRRRFPMMMRRSLKRRGESSGCMLTIRAP